MHHYYEPIQNRNGDVQPGYFARLIDPQTQAVVPIYADENGTPIITTSGIADMAKSNALGVPDLYVEPGTYNVEIYAPDGVTLKARIENVAMTSEKGAKGDQGEPGESIVGPPGASNNTRTSLDELKAADIGDVTSLYDGSVWTWTPGNYTGQADDVNIVEANSTALTTGAWVRQTTQAVSFKRAASLAVYRPSQKKIEEIGVSPEDFGAKGDGVTDDSDAIQRAVNFCLSSFPPRPLLINGYYKLNKSVNIDRPIDQQYNRFTIYGGAAGGGFFVNTAISMFDTTIPYTNAFPVTGEITFRDVIFASALGNSGAQTFASGKFLNMLFENCEWSSLRCFASSHYSQGWRFRSCRARIWQGTWFQSGGAYDFSCDDMRMKEGVTGFDLTSVGSPIMRGSFTNCTFEGFQGNVIRACGANQLTVDMCYIENNAVSPLKFDAGPQVNTLIKVSNCIFVPPDPNGYYNVLWGTIIRAQSDSNFCLGKLHDTTFVTGDCKLEIVSDVATTELYKGFSTGFTNPAFNGVGNVNLTDTTFGNVVARGSSWSGDRVGVLGPGRAIGPGEVVGGVRFPIQHIYGGQNPQTNPGFYGDAYWVKGSTVTAYPSAVGEPRMFICTASGAPGTWVVINL